MTEATKMEGAAKWATRMLKRDSDGAWGMSDEESGHVALAASKEATTVGTLERRAKGWHNGKAVTAPRAMLEAFGVTKREAERIEDESTAGDILATLIMSTDTPDRTSFSVKQEGWQLDNYRANPVLLFAHNGNAPPVGQAESVFVGMGTSPTGNAVNTTAQLRGVFRFARDETFEFGASIGRLVRDRFLRAGSVGFDPVEIATAEDRIDDPTDPWELMFPPLDFLVQELLEHSIVPIPANPEALDVTGRGAGAHDLEQLREWAVQVLDEGGSLVVPRSTLETIARAGTSARLSVQMFGGNMKPKLVVQRQNRQAEEDPKKKPPVPPEDEKQKRQGDEDEEQRTDDEDEDPIERADDDEDDKVDLEADPEEITGDPAAQPPVDGEPVDLPEKPTMQQLDAIGGRCPDCGFEGTLGAFEIPDEEEVARGMDTATLLRELNRRGSPQVGDDAELFNVDEEELGTMIANGVADAMRKARGRLDDN